MIDKTFKRVTIIFDKFIWTTSKWVETLLDRLLIANWDISKNIISNKNSKFVFEFWRTLFEKLNIKLLMSTAYHSQTDDQSKRTNQIVKIALRFFLIENSEIDWINAISLIQTNLNNSSNAITELCSNELNYDFKVKDIVSFLIENLKNSSSQFNIMNMINETRLRNRQKAIDAIFFINIKVRIIYDRKHKSLFLNSKNKIFLRLNKKYNLLEIINRKLFQQRCDLFTIKRRARRLTYELEFFKTWRVHFVIFVAQLELASKESNKRVKSNHFDSVFVKRDISIEKFHEIEQMLIKRTRQYETIKINQYLIRWKDYESKFDQWKNIFDLNNCIDLMKEFEQKKITHLQKKTRSRKKRVNSSRHQ